MSEVEVKPGRILHLQRLSTEDGPGIRTTVFFKGCPLACQWCHNPESIATHPQVQWLENRCIACLTCLDFCPQGGLQMTDDGLHIDWDRCQGCGSCAEACPANALELLGTTITVDELVKEVVKDRTYFETSSGGVTASGGEPTMQSEFVAAFFGRLQELGIPTALDTCGLASRYSLDRILPAVDLVLFDLKEIDPERHRAFTGQDNQQVFDRLLYVRDFIEKEAPQIRLWVRTPLIPGATATPENLQGIGAFLAENLNGMVERWDLCAFNNLCRDKYRRLGMEWRFDVPLLSVEELEELAAAARQSGVDPDIVVTSGATRTA